MPKTPVTPGSAGHSGVAGDSLQLSGPAVHIPVTPSALRQFITMIILLSPLRVLDFWRLRSASSSHWARKTPFHSVVISTFFMCLIFSFFENQKIPRPPFSENSRLTNTHLGAGQNYLPNNPPSPACPVSPGRQQPGGNPKNQLSDTSLCWFFRQAISGFIPSGCRLPGLPRWLLQGQDSNLELGVMSPPRCRFSTLLFCGPACLKLLNRVNNPAGFPARVSGCLRGGGAEKPLTNTKKLIQIAIAAPPYLARLVCRAFLIFCPPAP